MSLNRTGIIVRQVTLLACLFCIFPGILYSAENQSSFEKISDAYLQGEIDRTEMLFEQMKAVFEPDELSASYKSEAPTFLKSGTGLVMEVKEKWDSFTPEQQSLLASYLAPLTMQMTLDSPGGFFKIHYDTNGSEMVPPEDLNGDNIPDYVERIAAYCDSSRNAYLAMGYLPPPVDPLSGGDEKYDIQLAAIGAYGMTIPDGPGDSIWSDSESYIWLHNSYYLLWLGENDDPDGDTIGAQKVSCAHEYFHAVQLAYKYDVNDCRWLMEITATWMEEVVFPGVNDNHNYLPFFFMVPQHSITLVDDSYHMYGGFVWAAFLEQKFDRDIILKTWEATRYNTSLEATDSALAFYGTNMKNVMPEFTVWNYYTGERAIPGMYYADAAEYPLVDNDQSFTVLLHNDVHPIDGPDGVACNYVNYLVNPSSVGILETKLDGSDLVRWANSTVATNGGDDDVQIIISDGTNPIYSWIPFIEDYDKLTVIPSVITPYLTDNDYSLTTRIIPYGDANYDYETNVGDASYLINYVFKGGPEPKPILESGDANCDGNVNVADAVTIISYVFKGGEAPCAGRVSP